jgi:hypothetical protein
MLFIYDKSGIKFKNVKISDYFVFIFIPVMIISSFVYLHGYRTGIEVGINGLTYEEKELILESMDPFSPEKLVTMMKDIGIKYPWIPYAQSKLETGAWNGELFMENHNLFGMKLSTRRVSTAKGVNMGYAYYDTWRESVYDYAFYQCRYLGKLTSEEDYFEYLQANYAEDPTYVTNLKAMIEREGIKKLFEQ